MLRNFEWIYVLGGFVVTYLKNGSTDVGSANALASFCLQYQIHCNGQSIAKVE